jgi:acetyltransferase-like isoleucine patch superfamily enzyme
MKVFYSLMRIIAQHAPVNGLRIAALRACGFTIGNKVYIAAGTQISYELKTGKGMLSLGNRVSIGPGVVLVISSHANHSRITQVLPAIAGPISIGDDAWIGANATILHGVTIGEHAAIAAGAVVNQAVEPFTLVGGVPAKLIRNLKEQKPG